MQDIVCGEIGSDDRERWGGPVRLSPDELRAVEALVAEGVLQTRAEACGLSITGTDHVGTLALPTGRRLHIRPKVGNLTLLDWLAYLGDAPPLPPRTAGSGFALRGSFSQLLADHLLDELQTLTRRTLRTSSIQQRHDSSTVRGRVLPNVLARTFHRLPNLPQSRPARTLDTPYHRLLAAALDRLPRLLPDDETTARRLSAVRHEWSAIDRDPFDVAGTAAACAAHCPPGYAAPVRLASLSLLGASPARGTPLGGALLVSLAGVWERAVRRMCAEVAPRTGWRVLPDSARTQRWDDGPGLRDPARWMTADVLLEAPGRRWVLDAKYKRGYGDEERTDRFQMTAYAMAFGAGRATLVYPTATTPRPRWRLLLSGQIGGAPTRIDSIELPMSAGPAPCRQALLEAMLALGAPAAAPGVCPTV